MRLKCEYYSQTVSVFFNEVVFVIENFVCLYVSVSHAADARSSGPVGFFQLEHSE